MTAAPEDSLVKRLADIPLFSALEPDALERIGALVIPFDAPAGHVLVQYGIVGSGLFLIDEGAVQVEVHDKKIELGHGEFFGELALLVERATHTARVKAKTDVTGYCITRDVFTKLLEDEPKIALAMLQVVAHRLADVTTS